MLQGGGIHAAWAHHLAHLCMFTRRRSMSNTCCCLPLDGTVRANEVLSFLSCPLPPCAPSCRSVHYGDPDLSTEVDRVSQLPECVTLHPGCGGRGSGGAVKRDGIQVRTLYPDPAAPLSIGPMDPLSSKASRRPSMTRRCPLASTLEGDGEGRESDETCCWSIGLNLVPLPPRPPWTDADG